MITPKVITGPTKEPVSITEARNHLRVVGGDEDALIALYIAAAREWFEKQAGRTIHQTTYQYNLDAWPLEGYIILPRATPLISITSVVYYDENGTPTTWSNTEYAADTEHEPGRLVLKNDYSWPSSTLYNLNPIRITYVAGLAAASPAAECAASIKIPVLMLVGALYENREAEPLTDAARINKIALQYGIDAFIRHNITSYVC